MPNTVTNVGGNPAINVRKKLIKMMVKIERDEGETELARAKVARTVAATLRAFMMAGATREERAAAEEMRRRCLGVGEEGAES